MAKLTGVKTIDMAGGEITKVSYDGAEYAKVSGKATAGDLIYVTKDLADTSKNSFYAVVKNGYGDGRFYDDIGDSCGTGMTPCIVFRKVGAGQTLETRVDALESRVDELEGGAKPEELKVGDNVRVSGLSLYGSDHSGEVGTFERIDHDGDYSVRFPSGAQRLYKRGQLAKVEEDAKPQEIEHKGAKYALVDRKAQPGDVVVFTENISGCYVNGRAYGPAVLEDGAVRVGDRDGDLFSVYLAEFNRTESNTIVYAPAAAKLSVGDYAIITGVGDRGVFGTHQFNIGELVKITKNASQHDDRRYAENLERTDGWWVYDGYMRKATDEEIAQATKPKKDDIVVITANTNGSRNAVGDIGKVGYSREPNSAEVHVPGKTLGNGNNTKFSEMRLATPAEIAQYEAAEKPKLKVGDYAKVVRGNTAYNSMYGEGEIVVIVIDDGTDTPYKAHGLHSESVRWFREVDLAHLSEAEIKRVTSKDELKVGDIATVKVGANTYFDALDDAGTTVKITTTDVGEPHSIRAELTDGSDFDYFRPQDLIVIADKGATFAEVGRKTNEFRKGDVVRILDENHTGSRNQPGDIGVIESATMSGCNVNVEARNGAYTRGNHHVYPNLELIAPVESRVDLD